MKCPSLAPTVVLITLMAASAVQAQTTRRASVDSAGVESNDDSPSQPVISGDGRFVAFDSLASNLVPNDTNPFNDIFVHDLETGVTELVSIDSQGVQSQGTSLHPSISADGRYVAFNSVYDKLVPNDNNSDWDIFVHDRQLKTTRRVSVHSNGTEGNSTSLDSAMSADGRYVAFTSLSNNLVANDTNGHRDIFLHDCQTSTTTLISVDSNGQQTNHFSRQPGISGDGRFVGFVSKAGNLDLVIPDTNGIEDVFVHDRQTGTTERVSLSSGGTQGDIKSYRPSLSNNGRFVAFKSSATTLVSNDTNMADDVFVHDRQTGTTNRVSVDSSGAQSNGDSPGANENQGPTISSDGRFVAFDSEAINLVPNDTNGAKDIFVRDLQAQTTSRVSLNSKGLESNGASRTPSISANGRFVTFASIATNLVSGDTNGFQDIFVRDRIELAFNGTPAAGNPVNFTVSNAFGELGNLALVLVSCSGTTPGFPLPAGDGRTVCLNLDGCTTLGLLFGTLLQGTVGATGEANTPIVLFPQAQPGKTVWAAAVTIGGGVFVSITSPVCFVTL